MAKILLVKFGWSDFYQGGPVDGNFSYLRENAGGEAWTFEPDESGNFYVYTPPQGENRRFPVNDDCNGWKIFCVARKPKQSGLHLVGWFEKATLIGKRETRSVTSRTNRNHVIADHPYAISAGKAFLVLPDSRRSFSNTHIRATKYAWLSGPGVGNEDWRRKIIETLEEFERIARETKVAVEVNADTPLCGAEEVSGSVPFLQDTDLRKEVEGKSVAATISFLSQEGYTCTSVESLNIGYDIHAVKEGATDLFVEVKGTGQETPRFFLTRNEHRLWEAKVSGWRLAMVTSALHENPRVELYTTEDVRRKFDVEPFSWFASPKSQVSEV